jgi:hypothetical protein
LVECGAQARWSAVGVVWLLLGAACSERDATRVEQTASAGTAGRQRGERWRGIGGDRGIGGRERRGRRGGAGGALEPTDAGVARFRALQSGDLVELVALDEAWLIDWTIVRVSSGAALVQRAVLESPGAPK